MKLYHLQSGKLLELSEINIHGKPFDYEKTIQGLVENNLGEIFPALEFVKSEHQIDDLRPDTVAFNEESKSFVIIEYKNVQNRGVVDQGMSYYQLLQDKKEAFVLLYHEVKGKLYKVDDINWDETRIIFISPHFTIHQKRASEALPLPIELYEIKQYDDGIISFNKLERQTDNRHIQKKKAEQRKYISLPEYVEAEYLDGKYTPFNPTPEIRQLWLWLKNKILDSFEKLEFRQMKKYAGFYSKDDGSSICTIAASKSKITLCYSTPVKKKLLSPSNFVRDVSNIGHWGIGDYQSQIKNEEDIEKVIPLIQRVYLDKVKSNTLI